jgi:hypothetical protein
MVIIDLIFFTGHNLQFCSGLLNMPQIMFITSTPGWLATFCSVCLRTNLLFYKSLFFLIRCFLQVTVFFKPVFSTSACFSKYLFFKSRYFLQVRVFSSPYFLQVPVYTSLCFLQVRFFTSLSFSQPAFVVTNLEVNIHFFVS